MGRIGGQVRADLERVLAYDEFARYPDGALHGKFPLRGPAWLVVGASPVTIQGGRATANGASTGYAYLTFDEPVHYIESVLVFSGTDGGSAEMVMSWANASGELDSLLHLEFGGRGFTLKMRIDGTWIHDVLGGSWRSRCAYDGVTEYRVAILVRGDNVTIIGPWGEVFSVYDPRVAALVTSTVFWEPFSSATGRAELTAIKAIARPATGDIDQPPSVLDMAAVLGNIGSGPLAGQKNSFWEVRVGQHPSAGMPALTFMPSQIRTELIEAVGIGATAIVTAEPLLAGTLTLGAGADAETLTVTGAPSPLPGAATNGYTATLTTATTKAHAAGAAVIGAGGTLHRLQYNPFSAIRFDLDSHLNLSGGDLWRSSLKVVGTRRTGWTAPSGTATRTAFATGTATTAEVAERLKALIDDLIAHGLIGA